MASISRQPNGHRTIQFVGPDRKRRSIRLGKVTAKDASVIKDKIEHLLAAKLSGRAVDASVSEWISSLPDVLADRLVAVELIAPKIPAAPVETGALGSFLTSFIEKRVEAKASTKLVFGRVRKHLVAFFGEERPLLSITCGDACDWRQYLIGTAKLSDNTVRRHCGIARQFFKAAIRHNWISENPFLDEEIKVTVHGNEAKFHFVTVEIAEQILAACPDHEWRLLFALSRYGGLRCPSEHLSLTWSHVDWSRNRIIVPSPKTAHHAGKDERVIPLFPELRPYLEAAYERAEPGTKWVVTRYRHTNANLRTQLERIIRRAGLTTWPKLFHNLRATRQTELSDRFPQHVVSSWLGNSVAVAERHYLRTTDEHFERAITSHVAKDEKAVQKAVQHSAETGGIGPQIESGTQEKQLAFQRISATCGNLREKRLGDVRLELTTSTL